MKDNVIHIDDLTKGMSRRERRALQHSINKRNPSPPRNQVDKAGAWHGMQTMFLLRDATPLDPQIVAKNRPHMDATISRIDSGAGDTDALASIEQYGMTLFFLVLRLREAGKHDTAAIIKLMIAEDHAEDCMQAHVRMALRHGKTGKIGWTATERTAVIRCTETLTALLTVCNGSHARQALIDCDNGKASPLYLEKRKRLMAKLEAA